MSVYTQITASELQELLSQYNIGDYVNHQGISAGISNSLYTLTTTTGPYIFTLYEEVIEHDLPFYLELTHFLAKHGLPCPRTIVRRDKKMYSNIHGKPCTIIECLPGKTFECITSQHCHLLGDAVGRMHRSTHDYACRPENRRGMAWFKQMADTLESLISADQTKLIKDEITFQSTHSCDHLPKGIIHADLFRNNVLFENGKLTGLIDFAYACYDTYLYDLAIIINDWCLTDNYQLDPDRFNAFLKHYQTHRYLSQTENDAWRPALRRAALRFWLSRLHDLHFPNKQSIGTIHNPEVFQKILLQHRN